MKKIKYIKIDDIVINPSNARHEPVINSDFAILELIKEDQDAMYKLARSIVNNKFYPAKSLCAYKMKDTNKYILLDGNRRMTAVKILLNLDLIPNTAELNSFKNKIEQLGKINLNDFNEFPCAIYDNKEDAHEYLLTIHTNSSEYPDEKKWNIIQQNRFIDKSKKVKVSFSYLVLKNYLTEEQISGINNISTLDRLITFKYAKDIFKIDENGTSKLNKKLFIKILLYIIKDLNSGEINSRKLNNKDQKTSYLNELFDRYLKTDEKQNVKLNESINNITIESVEEKSKNDNIMIVKNNEKQQDIFDISKEKVIISCEGLRFKYISANKVSLGELENVGIFKLISELKIISTTNDYKKYPIATAILIRGLLESALIYYLKNKGKYNDNDCKLENIIKHFLKDKTLFEENIDIRRTFEACFVTSGMKNLLDLTIHQPDKFSISSTTLETISQEGLFAIIQYILN